MNIEVIYNKADNTIEYEYKGKKIKTKYLGEKPLNEIIKDNVIYGKIPKFTSELLGKNQ